jgi:hypothetical protein
MKTRSAVDHLPEPPLEVGGSAGTSRATACRQLKGIIAVDARPSSVQQSASHFSQGPAVSTQSRNCVHSQYVPHFGWNRVHGEMLTLAFEGPD